MGDVVTFPGVDPASIRPQPTTIADLRDGEHALVVVGHPKGFAVEVRPDELLRPRLGIFGRRREALQFARQAAANHPKLYRMILDETIEGRTSLDRIIGPGPDPMGLGGAA